jgi:hypothetical protein
MRYSEPVYAPVADLGFASVAELRQPLAAEVHGDQIDTVATRVALETAPSVPVVPNPGGRALVSGLCVSLERVAGRARQCPAARSPRRLRFETKCFCNCKHWHCPHSIDPLGRHRTKDTGDPGAGKPRALSARSGRLREPAWLGDGGDPCLSRQIFRSFCGKGLGREKRLAHVPMCLSDVSAEAACEEVAGRVATHAQKLKLPTIVRRQAKLIHDALPAIIKQRGQPLR